ncbi:HAD family hydrolase [Streptomyces acidiscabies]|uniref:HAD family hydrolase n=1 Tax=Streptomyces acidiscabies TaxID=42234 RepID=UPI0038F63461
MDRPRSSPSSPHTSLVVWDLGGVLAPSGQALTALAEALDLPEAEFAARYWAHRDPYDLGGTPTQYWSLIGEALGRTFDAEWIARLDRIDTAAWAVLADDSAHLLDRIARRGTPLGVLSNAPASLATAVRQAAWSARFETLVFSSDLGLMKPDPQVYRSADRHFGRPPSDVIFFDDRPVNVESAREHGWRAHVWTGVEAATQVLIGEGVLAG